MWIQQVQNHLTFSHFIYHIPCLIHEKDIHAASTAAEKTTICQSSNTCGLKIEGLHPRSKIKQQLRTQFGFMNKSTLIQLWIILYFQVIPEVYNLSNLNAILRLDLLYCDGIPMLYINVNISMSLTDILHLNYIPLIK